MPEPTKTDLLVLRKLLVELPADQPLPRELRWGLGRLISWASFRITRALTREQIRYQRQHVVGIFIQQYIAQHGKKRGSKKYAYGEAAKELTGPYAGSWRVMQDDYLFVKNAPSDDPRSVRYRETLERRAREADEKRARARRAR